MIFGRFFRGGVCNPAAPAKKSAKVELAEQLRAWRPIGATFEYLGRTCVVTSHWHLEGWGECGLRSVVGITADYADDNGVIRSVQFSAAESRALMESCNSNAGTSCGEKVLNASH